MAGGGSAIRGSRVGAGPMGEAERGDTAPRQRIVFFCAFGERSAMAVAAAKEAGLANTAHIAGGMDAWKKAGGPVLTG